MKSKTKNLNKTIKAAFPLLALFGGNGFASSRHNSISLNNNSKRNKQTSVVYINNDKANIEISTKNHQSPFATFTNKKSTKTKTAKIFAKNSAISFLKNNGLLTPKASKNAHISGNTITHNDYKNFSHNLKGRNNLIGSLKNTTTNACLDTNFSKFYYKGATLSAISSCSAKYVAVGYKKYNNIEQCQGLHNKCMNNMNPHTHNAQLPVELQEFKIE